MRLTPFLAFFCLFIFSLFAEPKTTYVYQKETEGRETKTTWTLEKNEDVMHIKGESGRGETLIITTPQMETQSFSFHGNNGTSEYSIFRDGTYLIARQNDQGDRNQREFNLGKRLWIQEFDFSFRPFILSYDDTLKFCIVHPQKLSLHNMVAKKANDEQITLHGETYQAICVKVTLAGFKKMFWGADLWFEKQTGDLLKYVANDGPNTPTNIITLLSKETKK